MPCLTFDLLNNTIPLGVDKILRQRNVPSSCPLCVHNKLPLTRSSPRRLLRFWFTVLSQENMFLMLWPSSLIFRRCNRQAGFSTFHHVVFLRIAHLPSPEPCNMHFSIYLYLDENNVDDTNMDTFPKAKATHTGKS